jgi:TPR repeat protein
MFALCASSQLHAQQSGDSFEDTKAKAQKGDANAQFTLGWMYLDGRGVSKDSAEALKWYRKAAEQGSGAAPIWRTQVKKT